MGLLGPAKRSEKARFLMVTMSMLNITDTEHMHMYNQNTTKMDFPLPHAHV
jgi:hypothetical protein